jgi:cell division septal protein FtsQ
VIGREATPRRRNATHARRPAAPLRRRVGRVLPAIGRILAVAVCAALLAGLVLLVNGPWLRVRETAWAGQRFTADRDIEQVLDAVRGAPLLTLDSAALALQLEQLPAVAGATVEARLPGSISVTLVEEPGVVVWRTRSSQLVCAADGLIIGRLSRTAGLPDDLAALPVIDDSRARSQTLGVGDRVGPGTLLSALRLAAVEPAAMGTAAASLSVRLDDDHGFVLISANPAWRAAFGRYEPSLTADPALLQRRIDEQLAAARTLFATQPETGVSWLDVRDPGRVYWRP